VDVNCQQIWQNFTQKDLTEVKIFQNVLAGLRFFETPCIAEGISQLSLPQTKWKINS